jgi:hypothetical protein
VPIQRRRGRAASLPYRERQRAGPPVIATTPGRHRIRGSGSLTLTVRKDQGQPSRPPRPCGGRLTLQARDLGRQNGDRGPELTLGAAMPRPTCCRPGTYPRRPSRTGERPAARAVRSCPRTVARGAAARALTPPARDLPERPGGADQHRADQQPAARTASAPDAAPARARPAPAAAPRPLRGPDAAPPTGHPDSCWTAGWATRSSRQGNWPRGSCWSCRCHRCRCSA